MRFWRRASARISPTRSIRSAVRLRVYPATLLLLNAAVSTMLVLRRRAVRLAPSSNVA